MSVNSKMTAIADEIRTLSGTSDTMGLDTMTTNLHDANTEVSNQSDLLAQITTALEGKATGGSTEVELQNKTVTPSTNEQIITADNGYDGLESVTVEGDTNLIAENIAEGVNIFGVIGTHSGGSSDGGNIETCTVTLDNESLSMDCSIYMVIATVIEDGVRKTYNYFSDDDALYSITIPNVVCESTINLGTRLYGDGEPYIDIAGSAILESVDNLSNLATKFKIFTFTAPSVANENCIIYYAYDAS